MLCSRVSERAEVGLYAKPTPFLYRVVAVSCSRMRRILVESGPLVHPHSSSGARGGRRGTMSADESEPEWRVDVIGARKTATKTTKNKPSSTSKSSKKLKETRKRDKADIESSGVVWLNDIEVRREGGVERGGEGLP